MTDKYRWDSPPDKRLVFALETLSELWEARHAWVETVQALTVAERQLAFYQAGAETRIVLEAGGEKALGANTEARKRALTVALARDEVLGQAQQDYDMAWKREALAKQEMYNYSDLLKIWRAAMEMST